MFIIGEPTSLCDAAAQGEDDVAVLLYAARTGEDQLRPHLMRYVAVATLAFIDAVEALGAQFFRSHKGWLSEDLSEIKDIKGCFDESRLTENIEKRLRDYVRNIVSAHRKPQRQSIGATFHALRAPEFPALFNAARAWLRRMEQVPVWFYGYSDGTGLNCFRAAINRHGRPIPGNNKDGFLAYLPAPDTMISTMFCHQKSRFQSGADAVAWADSFWSPRSPKQAEIRIHHTDTPLTIIQGPAVPLS